VSPGDTTVEQQHHLIGTPDVEMIANDPFKPHPARLRSVKDAGLGDFELTKSQAQSVDTNKQ
jgi:hypothetical protein